MISRMTQDLTVGPVHPVSLQAQLHLYSNTEQCHTIVSTYVLQQHSNHVLAPFPLLHLLGSCYNYTFVHGMTYTRTYITLANIDMSLYT